MPGTKKGARTAKQRHGKEFHRRVGSLGGNPVLLKMRKPKQK